MQTEFDHIAILVRNMTNAVESLRQYDWPISKIKEYPAEGTKEAYVGPTSASGRLLLMEPIGDGPYRNALAKRGPGLHHIAINVGDIMASTDRISGSGWYLHPQSLSTLEKHKTLWLARPGVPLLIEAVQSKLVANSKRSEFATRIEVPLPETKPLLASAIGIDQFQPSSEPSVFITIGGKRRRLVELLDVGSH